MHSHRRLNNVLVVCVFAFFWLVFSLGCCQNTAGICDENFVVALRKGKLRGDNVLISLNGCWPTHEVMSNCHGKIVYDQVKRKILNPLI